MRAIAIRSMLCFLNHYGKNPVFAPILSPRVSTVTAVKPGFFASIRRP